MLWIDLGLLITTTLIAYGLLRKQAPTDRIVPLMPTVDRLPAATGGDLLILRGDLYEPDGNDILRQIVDVYADRAKNAGIAPGTPLVDVCPIPVWLPEGVTLETLSKDNLPEEAMRAAGWVRP